MTTVLVTGAAGRVGSALSPRLEDRFRVRRLDRVALPDGIMGDVQDDDVLTAAVEGVDAVVHLAAVPDPAASWEDLVGPNLDGTRKVLAAAVAAGVPKVVFASSCHASGRYDVERVRDVDPAWPARPCCPYGVSKVYGEAAGRYFADVHGLSVVNLRLGQTWSEPLGLLGLQVWLSHDDLARAVTAALRADVRFGTYFAASNNTRLTWDLSPGRRDLGFVPVDDAEAFADRIDPTMDGPPCYHGAV